MTAQRGPAAAGEYSFTIAGDLDSRSEIHDLIVRFYREVAFDELLAPVFIDVAEVDWSAHIPKLIDFWCRVLLGHPGYDGYVLGAHRQVHEIEAFSSELFDRWYLLFVETVDDGWRGPIAEKAKSHAARIAATLARHLLDLQWQPPHRKVGGADTTRPVAREIGLALPDMRSEND